MKRRSGIKVTNLGQDEEAIESSNLSGILDNIQDGFITIDNCWRFTYINKCAAGNLGLKPEELIGQNLWERFPEIKGTDHEIYYRRAMQQHEHQYFEMEGVLTRKWYEIRVYPSAEGISIFWKDITERKRAEQIKKDVQIYAEGIVNTMQESFLILNKDLKVLSANSSFYRTFQSSPEETENKCIYDIGSRQWDIPRLRELLEDILCRETHFKNFEVDHVFPSIGRKVMLLNASRIYQKGTATDRILLTIDDITERKRAEEALRRRNQQLDLLSYTAGKLLMSDKPQQIVEELCRRVLSTLDCRVFFNYLVDGSKSRLHLNAYAGITKMTARKIEWLDYGVTVCGRAAREGVRIVCENIPATPDPRTELVRSMGIKAYVCHPLFSRGEVIGTLSFGTKSRSSFTEDELALMKTVSEHVALAIERIRAHEELERIVQERTTELEETNVELEAKIEEQKQAEEQIREQAELLDKAQDAIALRDLEHRIIYWNEGAHHLYGWTADEAKGKDADKLVYKKESPRLIEAKRSVIEKGEWIGELEQVTKEGKDIIIESHWTLIKDNNGKPKSILIINTDITEKKRLERQLLRAQRMESIGTLAGGIAHDLNNMLTPIMLSLQILKEKLTDDESQRLLSILERNSHRGADLIKQVLSFARGVESERNPLQIKHIVKEIEKIAKETFPRNIDIRTNIPENLWTIYGDATQVHQVIMNMSVNARDAMPGGGLLCISARNILITEKDTQMNTEAKAGPHIVISVSDTGTGIPPEIMDRIFEPFFTSKEQGKGTGLGLSVSLAIVKSHGGFIEVSSIIGEGAVFRVYLPAIKSAINEVETQHFELPRGNGEFILVVDDEDSIREVTSSTLKTNGYNVLSAENGMAAVTVYAENKEIIKLVLMDMMMPVMDGRDSIRAIRRINHDVKIIAASGLVEKDKLENIKDCRVQAFLPKPYTAENLLKTIHEILAAK